MLRAVPNKLLGVMLMGAAVLLPFFLPWLDRCRVKSIRYRGAAYKVSLMVFAVSFIGLGYCGLQRPTETIYWFCRIFTILYFAFFVLMPFYSRHEKTKPVPTRVTP
jgi:ubiquinol-cytochrome c reductase cytochrome b subunit